MLTAIQAESRMGNSSLVQGAGGTSGVHITGCDGLETKLEPELGCKGGGHRAWLGSRA